MNKKSSTDIWFIAFLMIRGEKIVNYQVSDKRKVRCDFEISNEKWQEYKLEFNNSEYSKFKTAIEQIKDLAFVLSFFVLTKALLCQHVLNQIA